MTMFPGAGAHVYYNEASEPIGWDYPNYDDPHEYDWDDRPWVPEDYEEDE